MSERHPDLDLSELQTELLEELGINSDEMYPICLRQEGNYCAPGGTGWADPIHCHLIFIDGEPPRFRYWMGEERAELIAHHRGVTVYRVSEGRLGSHPDPRETEAT